MYVVFEMLCAAGFCGAGLFFLLWDLISISSLIVIFTGLPPNPS
jgi:hypothetical protein